MKKGDIIKVSTFTRQETYRILWVYKDEPAMVLITPVDDYQAQPRCYHALLADCVLIEERDPPEQNPIRAKQEPEPIIKAFSRVSDEKQTWAKEYRNDSY